MFCCQPTQHAPGSLERAVNSLISDLTLKIKLLWLKNTALTQAATQAETDLGSMEQGNLSMRISTSWTISPIYNAKTDSLSTSSMHVSLPIMFWFLNKALGRGHCQWNLTPCFFSLPDLSFVVLVFSEAAKHLVPRPYLCHIFVHVSVP